MKWSFLTKVENKEPQVISSGLKCFRSRSTGERTWNPGLQVKASVQAKRLTPEPEFPRGRVFAIDSDEQSLPVYRFSRTSMN